MRKPLLKHTHIIKLGRILDMLYRPAELAEEIGVNVDTIYRSYLPAGLPYTRDDGGSLWIHGPAFVAWARQTITQRNAKRNPLPAGMAWCVKCKGPVPLKPDHIHKVNRYLELQQGHCPSCGSVINRARSCILPSPGCSSQEKGRGVRS